MTVVDVVVPVYNEEVDTARNIPVLREFLAGPAFPYDWRIVIGDNGSTDGTPDVSRDLQERYQGEVTYYRAAAKGKGRVIKETWLNSGADIVSFMDVDLSTDLEAFPLLISAIAELGYDVAIGSRLHGRSTVQRSLKRRALTRGYNTLVRALFRTHISDAQCGFKASTRDVARRVLPLVKDLNFFFDTEFLILAESLGYRVTEVPVKWCEDEKTSVKIVSTITTDLLGLARLRLDGDARRRSRGL